MTRSRQYVHLTLENMCIPDADLKKTPSSVDGLSSSDEVDLRIYGCEHIQLAGKLLQLPQVAMATAMNLFQRFYYRKSLVMLDFEPVAQACIFLAAKIEESPRRSKDILNVCHYINRVHRNKAEPDPLDIFSVAYANMKNEMIKAERKVLKELGFSVHIQHPHKLIANYLQALNLYGDRRLAQIAWNYMNDSFRTNVFCRFPPQIIATATIYLAVNKAGIPLPHNPPWFELFDATLDEIEEVCRTILFIVDREKKPLAELKKEVARLLKLKLRKEKEHREEQEKLKASAKKAERMAAKDGSATSEGQKSNTEFASNASPTKKDVQIVVKSDTADSTTRTCSLSPSQNAQPIPSPSDSRLRPGNVESNAKVRTKSPTLTPGNADGSTKTGAGSQSVLRLRENDRRRSRSRSVDRKNSRSRSNDRGRGAGRKERSRSREKTNNKGSARTASGDRDRGRDKSGKDSYRGYTRDGDRDRDRDKRESRRDSRRR